MQNKFLFNKKKLWPHYRNHTNLHKSMLYHYLDKFLLAPLETAPNISERRRNLFITKSEPRFFFFYIYILVHLLKLHSNFNLTIHKNCWILKSRFSTTYAWKYLIKQKAKKQKESSIFKSIVTTDSDDAC